MRAHQQTEYQALNVVISSLRNKFIQNKLLDERLEGYIDGYRNVLQKEFTVNQEFRNVTIQFNDNNAVLTELLKSISKQSQNLLDDEFSAAETVRKRLNVSFLVSSSLSVIALLVVLVIVARKIIQPVRSVARVIKDVQTGITSSRFSYRGNQKDDIVQLGLIFNDMLNTLEQNNRQLIDYQTDLEAKIKELDLRQQERETLISSHPEMDDFYFLSEDKKVSMPR